MTAVSSKKKTLPYLWIQSKNETILGDTTLARLYMEALSQVTDSKARTKWTYIITNLKSAVKWLIKQMKFPPSFFSWVSKVIHVCFRIFALLCSVTGQQNLLYFLNQQVAKPKQIVTHSHRFSCAFCQLHVFALSSVLTGQKPKPKQLLLWFWFYETQLKTTLTV